MPHEVVVAKAEEWQDGSLGIVEVDGHRIALCRVGEAFFAFDDRCPHAGSTLGLGTLHANAVECPRHQYLWRVTDGAALTTGGPLTLFEVRVEGDSVLLTVPDRWPEPAHWARHPRREELRRRHGFEEGD